jgi:DNA-binding beta-propeller fold protein YncE
VLDRRRGPQRRPGSRSGSPARLGALLVACAAFAIPAAVSAGSPAAATSNSTPTVSTIHVGDAPDRVVVGAGAVWVGDVGALARVDSRTEAVRHIPGAAMPIAVSGQAVWARAVLDFDTVERIDPTTGAVVAKIALLGSPAAIAADADAVWVVDSAGVLTRIDPTTNTAVATIPLGSLGFSVASTPDAVWVSGQNADGTQSLLWRIDPATNTLVATIDTNGPCSVLASGADDTWAECGTVQHIDPATNRLASTTTNALNGLAVGPQAIYALDTEGNLTTLDPQTGRAHHALHLPPLSEGIALGAGSVWVANPALTDATNLNGAGTLLRLRGLPGAP